MTPKGLTELDEALMNDLDAEEPASNVEPRDEGRAYQRTLSKSVHIWG